MEGSPVWVLYSNKQSMNSRINIYNPILGFSILVPSGDCACKAFNRVSSIKTVFN